LPNWSVYSLENNINYCHQISSFKTKMHQIRFRLGLRPTPHWGSSQRSPRPISCNTGRLTSKEKGGREENRGRKNQEERERGEEKETKSPIHVSGYATEKQKRGRATKREKMERMKKLRGRGGRQSWGKVASWR